MKVSERVRERVRKVRDVGKKRKQQMGLSRVSWWCEDKSSEARGLPGSAGEQSIAESRWLSARGLFVSRPVAGSLFAGQERGLGQSSCNGPAASESVFFR